MIPDSRFQIPDSRFQIPDSRFQIPDSRFQIFHFLFISIILLLAATTTSCGSEMQTPKESSRNNTALSQIYLRSGTASATKLPSRIALSLNPMDTVELSCETIPQLMQQSNSEALEKVSDTDTIGITHRGPAPFSGNHS